MAELFEDAYGVPHVRASDVRDLARGQGYAAARDRAWQLEHQRRRATGTAAAVLGAAQLPWDTWARRTRIVDTAQRALAGCDAETQAFVAAFVDGVNAGLHDDAPELERLAIAPEPWEPWTPLAVFHAQHLLFASTPAKLWHQRAREVLGAEEALLSRDPAYVPGSNAWAVGGARTRSGRPLIGGDPHRVFESPGVYSQVRLAVTGVDALDVVGFTFPGVPGVQHFAHAGEVAWAITNAVADYQDLYDESLDDVVDGHEEVVEVRGADPVAVEVWATERGPLFEVDRDAGRGTALRDAATVLGDLGFDALLPLLRSRTVDDVDRALDAWVAPVNNVVIADRDQVRFRYAGRVPVRAEANRRGIAAGRGADTWSGWVELPRHDVPADGQVVTANERRGSESDLLGTEFAPPHRADRIDALLRDRDDLTVADLAAIHGDCAALTAVPLRDALRGVEATGAGEEVRQRILAWDGVMAADSEGAAAFAAWRAALTHRICAADALRPLLDDTVRGPLFAAYLSLPASVGLALEPLVGAGTAFGVDVRRLAVEALADAADHPAAWGATHVFAPTHAFDVADPDLEPPVVPATPVSGDTDTVRCTGWLPGVTDEAYRGSVARYVWDLGDRARSGWVVPMGASGDPRSPHHLDQHEAWAEARLLPIELDWERLTPRPGGR
ncbi:penicillin acylase family protein [Nocardioides anomalus]|uniref:Penicillin acylase family protein n=1 Tax=Nocardioides anomalus TaxID=2712223 RepID=A0A6G6W9P3_9ACTN|nr:penicillin acylase family protein [Nocardioides anomalus]QIG42071.1 penicillin acylase family protein [Nocardioides anomalus]